MDKRADLIRRIKDHLAIYAVRVDMDKGEASRAAENFYCDLLNILLGYNLQNMNRVEKNYPAIDLGEVSEARKLGVQVTSTATRQKVQDTLDTFFRHEKEKTYTRLVMLVINKWTESRKKFRMDGTLDFDAYRDIWDTDWLLDRIEELEDIAHLEQIKAYMERHLDLIQKLPAPLDLPLRTAMDERNFVGRESELDEIAKRFDRNEKIVVLSGLGGMGKTELAVRFGRDYANSGRGRAYFVRYNGSFEQTIRENVVPKVYGLTREGKTEQQIYDEAIAVLKKCGRDDLLILDNANQETNLPKLRHALSELPMRILVTTRARSRDTMLLGTIDRETLYLIFERHKAKANKTQMDMLIDTVKGHTMTVDLIARTLGDCWGTVSPERIRDEMMGSSVSEEDYPEVDTDYEQSLEQRQIYAHLSALFQLNDINEQDRRVLCCATLLPADGMDKTLFMDALPAEIKPAARKLERRGWIQCENELVTIHPVVRMVCRRELEPKEEDCEEYLLSIADAFDSKQYNKVKYHQFAELFSCASNYLEDELGSWAYIAGYIWKELWEERKSLIYILEAVAKREKNQPESAELASAYSGAGVLYSTLGDYDNALKYGLKGLEIREQILPCDHLELADSYNNVGGAYADSDEKRKALDYMLKALHIREKVLPLDDANLAQSYNNVGTIYFDLFDFPNALKFGRKALSIREKILSSNHPDLAQSYSNVGSAYTCLGEHREAEKYMLKSLWILEQSMPNDHPVIVSCCGNIATNYARMGKLLEAREYADRSLEMAEHSMQGHPNLALYRGLASIMRYFASLQEQGIPFDNPFKPK